MFVAADAGPLVELLREANIPITELSANVRHPSRKTGRVLRKAIESNRIELVCTTGFNMTLDAVPAALLSGVPLFPTYPGLFLPPYPQPWLPRVNVFSEELSGHLVQRHGWEADTFCNLIARIDGSRFNDKVNGSNFRDELKIPKSTFVLTMVCRQDKIKQGGIQTLLDASMELKRLIPELAIVFFGDGPSRYKILERIGELNKSAGSTFLFSPGATRNTPEAYAMADVIIANGARSAMEGMACGKPVISVGPNGFCGVITERSVASFRRFNFDKGRLLDNPIGSTENLLNAINVLYSDKEMRRSLGEFSARYAGGQLLVQTAGSAYERIYESILKSASRDWPWKKIMFRWTKSVFFFYWQRVKGIFSREAATWRERLAPPVRGVEPEWEAGLL